MTIAVAVRKDSRTVLAADSLVHFGGQRFPPENCRFNKIFRMDETSIVWAGWSLYAELLTAHLARNAPPTLATEADVFSFFVRFWRSIREEYTFISKSTQPADHPFADLESVFLLVNSAGMFRIAGDMDVTAFKQYSAVGSGSNYALGALRVLFDQDLSALEIARRAVQVGIDFDVHCGGLIDVIEIE